MTPEERAFACCRGMPSGAWAQIVPRIAAAIREAVAEEREACAKLADEAIKTGYAFAISENILARSEP